MSKETDKPKFILVTHNDLDGVACEVIFKACYGKESTVYSTSPTDVNDVVRKIIEKDNVSRLLITDLSVDEEVAKLLDKRGNVQLFDHHKTALWLNQYPWAMVNVDGCGASLLYLALKDTFDIAWYDDFIWAVECYDLWRKDLEGSFQVGKQLNALLKFIGRKWFVARMLNNNSVCLTSSELAILDAQMANTKRYIRRVFENATYVDNWAVVFANAKYASEIGDYTLTNSNINRVAIIDLGNGTVSLRSRGDEDVSVLAKSNGGGGHKHAAGYPLSKGTISYIVSTLVYYQNGALLNTVSTGDVQ